MQIQDLPGVYYVEDVTYELNGSGSKIPVFIGKTGNTTTSNYKVDGTEILEFNNATEVFRAVTGTGDDWKSKTGIGAKNNDGTIPSTNELGNVINEFYEEARLLQSTDIGVPKIYVVDVGNGQSYDAWVNAIKNVKALYEAPVEVYVGLDSCTVQQEASGNNEAVPQTIPNFVESIADSIHTASRELNLRYAFFTKKDITDADIKTLSDQCLTKLGPANIQKLSRIGLCEPFLFGKTIARICCTPYNTEPGYYKYRSVTKDTFIRRTLEDATALQNKGIIFNRDEYINGNKYPKINLCVSLAFNSNSRPADSLFHARFNADDLLREVFEACYTQVKANESVTNIAYLQARINKIINDRVTAEEMVKYNEKTEMGTKLTVLQSDDDPYSLLVKGQIQPIKCTIAIKVQATVKI